MLTNRGTQHTIAIILEQNIRSNHEPFETEKDKRVNRPFDFPRYETRGLLRVDTEGRYSPLLGGVS